MDVIGFYQRYKKWIILVFLVVLASFLFFSNIGKGSLSNDEGYNPERAKEMLETGDFLTVHLYGQPNFLKPPLVYGLMAVTYRLFGISEFTSRFWPALFGVGCVVLVYLLGIALSGTILGGLISALVLLTTPHFVHMTQMAKLDVPVLFFHTPCWIFFMESI